MRPCPPALLPVLLIGAALLGSCSSPPAAHDHARVATSGPPPLFTDLGRHHRAITTTSPEAQAYFDQGLRLLYCFNH